MPYLHAHEHVVHLGDGVGVCEHALVLVVHAHMVQQTQDNRLETRRCHQLHGLQSKGSQMWAQNRERSWLCAHIVGKLGSQTGLLSAAGPRRSCLQHAPGRALDGMCIIMRQNSGQLHSLNYSAN